MTDETINLNHNAAECIHSATKFGEDVYYNICNGSVNHIPWGGVNWLLCALGVAFCLAVIIMLLGIVFSIVFD